MGISRAAQSPATVHRSFKITRLHRRDVNQVRTLWWWGRKNHGLWSGDRDDVEEKLRRHQALMMHRYSKAMRRRSLWERDNSPSTWRLRGCNIERDMSSTQPLRAKVEERDTPEKTERQTWQEFHKDFESFKRAVDKAIERDPVGTLFGRTLRSPNTPNNAAWTSWSWIFDPKEIKEVPASEPVKAGEAQSQKTKTEPSQQEPTKEESAKKESAQPQPHPSVSHSFSSGKTTTTLNSSHSIVFKNSSSMTTEYVYDPISGRKIPQSASPSSPAATSRSATEQKSSQPDKRTSPKGFIQTMFGEHGVDIPVTTYKPPKVFGYTGEKKTTLKLDDDRSSKYNFGTSRKSEYNQLRLRTLGNNIDATNFNCEPWNNQEPEAPKTEEPIETTRRTSPAPSEDAPLFSGTTYASKSSESTPAKTDWLAKEGFGPGQTMYMAGLNGTVPKQASSKPAAKMQPAIDRTNASSTEVPVKKFGSKLQPAMDRIISPTVVEPQATKPIPMQAPIAKDASTMADEKKEDLDLLRASDVRAASKAVRVTRQDKEDSKKQARNDLEKDFTARQEAEASPSDTLAGAVSSAASSDRLSKVWKHIKNYPDGIVAKTMQNMGIAQAERSKVVASDAKTQATSSATGGRSESESRQIEQMAAEVKRIYDQSIPDEQIPRFAPAQTQTPTPEKPLFSKPTVKPGVVRNLEIERHTQKFEPQIADIKDKAKAIKRELHDVSLRLGDFVNEKSITAIASRALEKTVTKSTIADSVVSSAPAAANMATSVTPSSSTVGSFDSPYILLVYNNAKDDIEFTPLNNLMGQSPVPGTKTNAMAAIGSLKRPNAFVKYFVDLDQNGYQLASGGGDMLIFQKKQTPAPRETPSPLPSTSELRSTIAAAEAAAQPSPSSSKKAATVLDDLPSTIPIPGPSAPTAPSSTSRPPKTSTERSESQSVFEPPSTSAPTPRKSRSRITRQEQVFSGQVRLPEQTTRLPDPGHFQKQAPAYSPVASYQDQDQQQQQQQQQRDQQYSNTNPQPSPGFLARLRRAIRRVVLTTLALAGGAYGIGVLAEGVNAKAQIKNSDVGGPMRKVVFEDRRRAGGEGRGR